MKFRVSRASDFSRSIVEINTLEELAKFQNDCGDSLIIAFHRDDVKPDEVENTILIYDGYIE